MAFRFFCPQGHILEADLDQVGQAAACPFCGMAMLIPPPRGDLPLGQPPGYNAWAETPEDVPPLDAGETSQDSPEGATHEETATAVPATAEEKPPGETLAHASAWSHEIFHIPCPRGHLLETPDHLLGTEAMCPFCQAVFRLEYEQSQEYQAKLAREREEAQRRQELFWIRLAVAAVVLFVIGLIALIVSAPR